MPVSLNWKPQSGYFWASALYLHVYTEESIAFQMPVLFCLVLLFSISSDALHPEICHPAPGIPKCWARPPGSTCCEGSSGRPVAGQPFSHFYAQGRGFVVSCWIRAVEFFFYSEEQSVPISLIKKFLCLCKIPGRKPSQRFSEKLGTECPHNELISLELTGWTEEKRILPADLGAIELNTYKRKTFFLFPRNDTFL